MKFEVTTERGEVFGFKIYRNGDATVTVKQGDDWRTGFLSAENVDKFRTFLASDGRDPVFKLGASDGCV